MAEQHIYKAFRNEEGNYWYLVFAGNMVYVTASREPGAPKHIVNVSYLRQNWMLEGNRWTIVPERPPVVPLASSVSACLEHLLVSMALDFLPFWQNTIWVQYTRKERKAWSHDGATTRYGDVGNKVYAVVIHLLLSLRDRLRQPSLDTISWLNIQKQGDILEGIMGLKLLFPSNATFQRYGGAADVLSAWAYETWNEPVNFNVRDQPDVVDILWRKVQWDWLHNIEESQRQEHIATTRVVVQPALQSKLPSSVIRVVCSFLVGDGGAIF
jgi:hypothetical protein